ncbi:DUF1015 domain-containing protein [Acidipila sp. EB88]|uniref:DUF1015 domain-containing protein n=1 Tax=Acidipila sp. EB88 TaxID=2305226 RepID=UPI000F5DE4A6|nr:DUF1015 domain-containing protein [Acidipila sp. EB88]RRA48888.1 DUF1015 domain-containing protein [Acidipila sp. EB88]
MARIFPFRALRYNPSLVRVEDCVTQPYDKITPSMQQSYYSRSPYNLVRIILGLPELFDETGVNDVYTRAARDFADWREAGVLAEEPEPCVFAYAQRFQVPGTGETAERRGLIALGAVSPYSEGVVFRHEQTHTRARVDRLNLLRATRAHFGQIFMLYSDPAHTVESLVFPAAGKPAAVPEIELTDEFGTLHRVWRISDPATINMVQGALGDKKLIIADGHHRYETALAYAAEQAPATALTAQAQHGTPGSESRAANSRTPAPAQHPSLGNPALAALAEPAYPEAAVLMCFHNMDSVGLHILPTHRIVSGLRSFDPQAFLQAAEALCTRVELLAVDPRQPDALFAALAEHTAAAGPNTSTILAVLRDQVLMLSLDAEARERALPQVPARKRQLDLVVLHDAILHGLLGISPEAVKAGEYVQYAREAADAVAAVLRGDAELAFLVNPVTLEQLRENSFAGEVMPQKSTDFYPKLLSGLAIYALDEQPAGSPGSREA